jgi:hypothetical protein
MTLAKHIEEATSRLESAQARIADAREQAPTLDNLDRRLSALEEAVTALTDMQSFNVESIHEKLHELAERIRVQV